MGYGMTYRLCLATFRCFDLELDAFARGIAVGNFCVHHELHALLGQELL